MMPLMIGAAALGLDTIQLSLWKRQLQRMADSGAMAGAHALVQEKTARTAVLRDLTFNNQLTLSTPAVVENAPTAGAYVADTKAVRVILSAQRTLPFWQFFQGSSPTITVEATAAIVKSGTFCLMALEEAAVTAINFGGNATVNLGCGLAANSPGNPAIDASGSAELYANPLIAVGALDADNPYFGGATVMPFSDKQEDPFASRPDPSIAASAMDCSKAWVPGNGPGCYSSMDIDSTVTLPAGDYYIKNGDANFGSKANVTGTDVALIFTGDGDSIGKLEMNGQAQATLKGRLSGDYKGMVIVRDDDRLTMDTWMINGGNELNIEGAIYMPRTHVWINGNSELASECLQLVAQRLTFKGNMDLENNCSGGHGQMFEVKYVRLVA
jgi:hypothetical protein